jgi:hypothetical protein
MPVGDEGMAAAYDVTVVAPVVESSARSICCESVGIFCYTPKTVDHKPNSHTSMHQIMVVLLELARMITNV